MPCRPQKRHPVACAWESRCHRGIESQQRWHAICICSQQPSIFPTMLPAKGVTLLNFFFFKRKREQEHEQAIVDGLSVAIEHFVEEIQAVGGPDIEFCQKLGRDRIPRNLRKAAFRIVKESLANACRHSKNKRLFVELSVEDDVLRIRLRDWGVDFDPVGTAPGRFGLNGTRRRVKLLSGTATIEREPGKGTCVTAEIPLLQKRHAVSIGERRTQTSRVKQATRLRS